METDPSEHEAIQEDPAEEGADEAAREESEEFGEDESAGTDEAPTGP